ncbi:tRNA lysidine(34) synthetase TilS [Thermobrachium celere]|uniref:tRNA(Ile)-lysidine synthase n=1 Tax=Thermobrachium celere DSM 8682 TaxID=941824 RepID=R7RUJ7_9CLOT|nr:tRNA lysidine(34) synthetase TilS [Thermobrachium celere]CDF59098.1 tRNA(Ile)-lysidine synthetase [Thermobrachium celere DSM 8682]
MKEKVLNYIKANRLIDYGDKIVVGLSGGPDSVCLLHILCSLRDDLNITIYTAHVNHMIRGEEAFRDEEYSKKLAESLGVEHFNLRVKVEEFAKENKMTSEEAGRFIRYKFFDEVLNKVGANKIALAHNMNDNAETILMNLIRGTGTLGLVGIPNKRDGKYIRPIMCLTRDEIEEYCKVNGLNPQIDSTNRESIYTRNKVRLELIPYIKENFNSNIIESLNRLSEIIKYEEEFLQGFVDDIINSHYKDKRFSISIFNKQHVAIKRRIIRRIIEIVIGKISGIEQKHIDECIELIHKAETGKYLVLPHNIVCKIEYDNFMIDVKSDEITEYEYKINIPGVTYIPELNSKIYTNVLENLNNIKYNTFIKYFDYDKIGNDIVVRSRRQGDYIVLSGIRGKKKLKDFFIDKKVPRDERQRIPLVAKGSEVVWIIGMRDNCLYKVSSETKRILEIRFERGAENE